MLHLVEAMRSSDPVHDVGDETHVRVRQAFVDRQREGAVQEFQCTRARFCVDDAELLSDEGLMMKRLGQVSRGDGSANTLQGGAELSVEVGTKEPLRLQRHDPPGRLSARRSRWWRD